MKIKSLLGVFSMSLLLLGACGEDTPQEETNTGGGPDGPGGSGTMAVYTPEQSKKYISEAATEFVNTFNPSDQEAIIELAADFGRLYSDLDAPSFGKVARASKKECVPTVYIMGLAEAVRTSNPLRAAAATATHVYNIGLVSGVYEPGRYSWQKVADSKNVEFRFTDSKGKQCVLKAVPSATMTNVEVEIRDYDGYYDYNKDKYVYYYDSSKEKIEVPTNIEVTLTRGSETLASSSINSNFDVPGHTISNTLTTSLSKVKFTSTLSGTDPQVKETATMSYNGKTLVTASAGIKGSNLCNLNQILKDVWHNEELDYSDDYGDYVSFDKYISSGSASFNLLDKIQLYAQGQLSRELMYIEGDYWYGDYYDQTKQQALRAVNADIATIKKYVKGQLRFNNTATDQATLSFQPVLCDHSYSGYYGSYTEGHYDIEPIILFSDGSSASFEEFGERGFSGLAGAFQDVVDSYTRIWNKYANK